MGKSPDLRTRVITAVVLIALLTILYWLAHGGAGVMRKVYYAVIGLIVLQCARELYRLIHLAREDSVSVFRAAYVLGVVFPVVVLWISLVGGSYLSLSEISAGALLALLVIFSCISLGIIWFVIACGVLDENEDIATLWGQLSLASMCLVLGAGALMMLAFFLLPHPLMAAWYVAVVSSNDMAAYFVGRSFGTTPVAPVISPSKTVEGTFAGLIAGSVVGMLLSPWFLHASLLLGGLAAFAIVLTAQAGDFAKSSAKRAAHVKDSGSILPGHGGLLDRLDGFLLSAPVYLAALAYFSA